jgi:hypothetical protein
MEAVLSVRKLAGYGFFHVGTLLKKEENIRRGTQPWISFGVCYKQREMEAQKGASEVFDGFLKIARANRDLITSSPIAWAYAQTDAFLREEFGSSRSLQEFHQIRLWIKEYSDGDDAGPMPALSRENWKEYLCRENWRAPSWLRITASRHFTDDPSIWDDVSEQNALQRLSKQETENLLSGICDWFWCAVQAKIDENAALESVKIASEGLMGPVTKDSRVQDTGRTFLKQPSADEPELSKGVREGKSVDVLYGQLKSMRKAYREKGLSISQIRRNTSHELSIVWEWIDRISDAARKQEFLKIEDWDDGDKFIFLQIATLYEYAPHLSKKPRWSTIRDWRKALRGHKQHGTVDGRKEKL